MKPKKAVKMKPLKVTDLDLSDFEEYKSIIDLDDRKKLIKILTEMFVDGEHDSFVELVELYIHHVGKREFSKQSKIPERSIYNFLGKEHKTSSENIFKIMKVIGHPPERSSA